MSTESFTIRTNQDKVAKLNTLAAQQDRSRNYIVNQAIDYFLALEEWQIEKTMKGLEAADQGDFSSDKTMQRVFDKYKPQ